MTTERLSTRSLLTLLLLTFTLQPIAGNAAEDASNSISSLKQAMGKYPENMQIREKLAKKLSTDEKWAEVIETLAPYSAELSNSGLMLLANSYKSNKDYINEIRILEIIVSKKSDQYLPHFLLGRAYKNNKQIEKAVEYFRISIKIQSRHKPSYVELLKIFRDIKKNNYESRIIVNDMIKVFGLKPEFYSYKCRLFTEDSFLNNALANCSIAVRKDPKNKQNFLDLARVQNDLGETEQAKKVYITATKKFPRSEEVNWTTGHFFFAQNNYQSALRFYKKAAKIDKKSSRALAGMANTYFQLNKYDKSLLNFIAACKIDKKHFPEFRVAGAKLDQIKNTRWANRFNSKYYICK